jgi:hypothetical protein
MKSAISHVSNSILGQLKTGTELTLTHARLKTEDSRIGHEHGWAGAINKLAHRFSYVSAGACHDQA